MRRTILIIAALSCVPAFATERNQRGHLAELRGFGHIIAYQTDYVTAREELKVIDATARTKKCDAPSRG